MAKKIAKHTSFKLRVQEKRRKRVRKKVTGSAERPRLCVTKTNRSVSAQLIDDTKGVTLIAAYSTPKKTTNKTLAKELGKAVAAKAVSQGIKVCVFDRGGKVFHGRVAAVAEGAREGGLQF